MSIILNSSFHRNIVAIATFCVLSPGFAAPSEWIDTGPSIEGKAKIQLNTKFSKKSGKFKALPESMLDQKDVIEGDFVVGTYRYIYSPEIEESGHRIDEMMSTEIMDCANKYYGTLRQIRKYKGKIVSDKTTIDKDVLMMETLSDNNDSQLCELHAGGKPNPVDRRAITNPDYKPKPTGQDIDAILDKYAPKGPKK